MNRLNLTFTKCCTLVLFVFTTSGVVAADRCFSLAGKVQTVRGSVAPQLLGDTLMHEHLFLNVFSPELDAKLAAAQFDPKTGGISEAEQFANQPMGIEILDRIWTGAMFLNRDNSMLTDVDTAVNELQPYIQQGGGSLVEVTSRGLGREPEKLLQVSRETGLNIIMGTGFYRPPFHPPEIAKSTIDEIASIIVGDITQGVGPELIRSGVIGEIGIDANPYRSTTDDEIKVLIASVRAARATGAPLSLHTWWQPFKDIPPILDVIEHEGLSLDRVIVGHAHTIAEDLDLQERLLQRGVYLQFDLLGMKWPLSPVSDDRVVARSVKELIFRGYGDKLLFSHDVATKAQLIKWGGHGFGYMHRHFIPYLTKIGVGQDDISRILVANPATILAFDKPHPEFRYLLSCDD